MSRLARIGFPRRKMLKLSSSLAACALSTNHRLALSSEQIAQHVKYEILMLIYPSFTALDLIGPQHVFAMLGPEYQTRLVWKDKKEVVSDTGVPIRPTLTFDECRAAPTVLFIPGGTDGTLAAMEDKQVREFVAQMGSDARYVTSICTGSLVLGASGLLQGYKATSHWLAMNLLSEFGAEPVKQRVVVDRNRITGAGVTAGIDFALTLTARLQDEAYAKAVQLMMEYDPKPPFDSGSPKRASTDSVKMLESMVRPFVDGVKTLGKQLSFK